MAAAWSDDALVERPAGSTVSMNVAYAAAAVASDLTAHARVVRVEERGVALEFLAPSLHFIAAVLRILEVPEHPEPDAR